METHVYSRTVKTRFGGVLRSGSHDPDGRACALEAASVARGIDWTDDSRKLRLPNLLELNDARWPSDQARTVAMVPLVESLWNWGRWSDARKRGWLRRNFIRIVREVLPICIKSTRPKKFVQRCRTVGSLVDAYDTLHDVQGPLGRFSALRQALGRLDYTGFFLRRDDSNATPDDICVQLSHAVGLLANGQRRLSDRGRVLRTFCQIATEEARRKP